MNSKFTLSTKGWIAVGLVACLCAAIAVRTGEVLLAMVVFTTSVIAAFDSTHIHVRRYKTVLSYGPVGLFVICALFWPFTLIWYFVVRIRIARGTMPLRSGIASGPTPGISREK